jgi:hypothetical protein
MMSRRSPPSWPVDSQPQERRTTGTAGRLPRVQGAIEMRLEFRLAQSRRSVAATELLTRRTSMAASYT